MCPELLLAFLYFLTIASVNYFLYKIGKNFLATISSLQQFKHSFSFFSKKERFILSLLYFLGKQEFAFSYFSIPLEKEKKDSFFFGKLSGFLQKNFQKKPKVAFIYYFFLLKQQYES
jgi:hypothetical protein